MKMTITPTSKKHSLTIGALFSILLLLTGYLLTLAYDMTLKVIANESNVRHISEKVDGLTDQVKGLSDGLDKFYLLLKEDVTKIEKRYIQEQVQKLKQHKIEMLLLIEKAKTNYTKELMRYIAQEIDSQKRYQEQRCLSMIDDIRAEIDKRYSKQQKNVDSGK